MLAVINPKNAVVSPCYDCIGQEDALFPHCATFCWPLNEYLISIGEKPHIVKRAKLYQLFPPRKPKVMPEMTTYEQYLECCDKINDIMKRKAYLSQTHLSLLIGISQPVISAMCRYGKTNRKDRKNGTRQTHIRNYKIIMECDL